MTRLKKAAAKEQDLLKARLSRLEVSGAISALAIRVLAVQVRKHDGTPRVEND